MSETTKRIENILGMYLFCEDNPPKGLVKELATHLHQEVIRGKQECADELEEATQKVSADVEQLCLSCYHWNNKNKCNNLIKKWRGLTALKKLGGEDE